MSFIGAKRAVSDIYPIKQKRFFVLTDPHSLAAPGGTTTITALVEKKAKVIVAFSFGDISGVPINLSEKQRDVIVNAFREENGLGLTNFFFNLPPKQQLDLLKKSNPSKPIPKTCNENRGTGKTPFFASLPLVERQTILQAEFPSVPFSTSQSSFPFVAELAARLPAGTTIHFVPDPLNLKVTLKPGEVAVLENLQLYKNEQSAKYDDRQAIAQVLATYADVFVNDAFATAQEVRASNVNLPRILRHGAAGYVMEKELLYFNRVLTHPARPTGVVIGGSKVDEKLRLIRNLLGKVDVVLVGGSVALPFLAASDVSAGKGLDPHLMVDCDGHRWSGVELAKTILAEAAARKVRIVLPVDHTVHNALEATKNPRTSGAGGIPSDMYAMDIGPNTGVLFAKAVKECNTVFWTGTLGFTDIDGFSLGTENFAKALVGSGALTVVGGSHTVSAVQAAGVANAVSHLSSGGTASLEILQGNPLQSIDALSDAGIALDTSSTASVNELLRHLPLFAGCTSHQLSAVARKALRRSHAVGDYLTYDGDRFTCMWVVSSGGLVAVAKNDAGALVPTRTVDKGHSIGQYEFITHATGNETVKVAKPDTVTYQLTLASLLEAFNELPELAEQLVANLSLPMRALSERQHHHASVPSSSGAAAAAGCPCSTLVEDAQLSRTPNPFRNARNTNSGTELLSSAISTIALNTFTQEIVTFKEETGTCILAQYNQGLPMRVLMSLVRSFVYNSSIASHAGSGGVISGAVLSAVATTPLRLASTGVPLNKITSELFIDQALISAASSFAPLVAHGVYLHLAPQAQAKRGHHNRVAGVQEFLIAVLSRLLTGAVFFPIIARRQTGALSIKAFLTYLLKQVLALLLDVAIAKLAATANGPVGNGPQKSTSPLPPGVQSSPHSAHSFVATPKQQK